MPSPDAAEGDLPLYDRVNRRILSFAESRKADTRTPFVWGFIEATFFVIVPDVAIGYAAAHGLKRGLRAVGWAVLGALLGGLFVYAFPHWWQGFFPHLPGINEAMMHRAAAELREEGWWAIVVAPQLGIPYKVYAAEAAIQGMALWVFLLTTPVARAWRFLVVALVGAFAGRLLHRQIREHALPALVVYLVFWALNYVLYFRFVAAEYA